MTFLKRLTATHKTELFLLALTAAFDLSFGAEKLLLWLGRPLSDGWLALLYITLGLIVAGVGVYNLISDINSDCKELGGPTVAGSSPQAASTVIDSPILWS